ncbi:MAG: hypothetical protein WDN06_13905 [Asticcacaulis sp.]
MDLAKAKTSARNWYLRELGTYVATEAHGGAVAEQEQLDGIGKFLSGDFQEIKTRRRKGGVTFTYAAEYFVKEFTVITEGERNAQYVQRGAQAALPSHFLLRQQAGH